MSSLFVFLLLVYAFWDNYKGDVIYSPKIDMYHRTFYTSVLHLINLCYIFGLLRSFLFYCIFYYCLLFLSFLCYHIREKYFFLGNVFVVKFIIPFLKLLLFFYRVTSFYHIFFFYGFTQTIDTEPFFLRFYPNY